MIDLSMRAVALRIRQASAATDLKPTHRLYAKIDMSAPAIARRLRAVSQMRDLCLRLRKLGSAL